MVVRSFVRSLVSSFGVGGSWFVRLLVWLFVCWFVRLLVCLFVVRVCLSLRGFFAFVCLIVGLFVLRVWLSLVVRFVDRSFVRSFV